MKILQNVAKYRSILILFRIAKRSIKDLKPMLLAVSSADIERSMAVSPSLKKNSAATFVIAHLELRISVTQSPCQLWMLYSRQILEHSLEKNNEAFINLKLKAGRFTFGFPTGDNVPQYGLQHRLMTPTIYNV